jgi:hypothetical protein
LSEFRISIELILAFTLLGLFPLLAKQTLDAMKARKVYARWPRPARFERNLVVIGAGSAGLVTAYIAAAVKAKVTLIEKHRMGGDCLNYGCVPSKSLLAAARRAQVTSKATWYTSSVGCPERSWTCITASREGPSERQNTFPVPGSAQAWMKCTPSFPSFWRSLRCASSS